MWIGSPAFWKTNELFGKKNNFLEPSFTSLLQLAYQSTFSLTKLLTDCWGSTEMNSVDSKIKFRVRTPIFYNHCILLNSKQLFKRPKWKSPALHISSKPSPQPIIAFSTARYLAEKIFHFMHREPQILSAAFWKQLKAPSLRFDKQQKFFWWTAKDLLLTLDEQKTLFCHFSKIKILSYSLFQKDLFNVISS